MKLDEDTLPTVPATTRPKLAGALCVTLCAVFYTKFHDRVLRPLFAVGRQRIADISSAWLHPGFLR